MFDSLNFAFILLIIIEHMHLISANTPSVYIPCKVKTSALPLTDWHIPFKLENANKCVAPK